MKTRITLLGIVLMVMTIVTACGRYDAEEDFKAEPVDGGKGVAITGYTGNKFEVRIPPKIQNLPVTHINYRAFMSENIVSIIIPNSVVSIEGGFDAANLATISVGNGNTVYSSNDGVLYNKNKTTLVFFPPGRSGAYAIPNSVTSIEYNAFYGCINLTSITIPNSVTSIGHAAFAACTSLTGITIPNSVTSIEESAFSGCTSLASVNIPNSVTNIGGWTFDDCWSLTSITIPSSVTSIGRWAFADCISLTAVTFEGTIVSSMLADIAFGDPFGGSNNLSIGDLRTKYLAGGIGTYTRQSGGRTWTKQP